MERVNLVFSRPMEEVFIKPKQPAVVSPMEQLHIVISCPMDFTRLFCLCDSFLHSAINVAELDPYNSTDLLLLGPCTYLRTRWSADSLVLSYLRMASGHLVVCEPFKTSLICS